MTGNEVREKYLKFFEKQGHIRIVPAPLVLKDDPTTLFTSSGMQPLVPYLMGKQYPGGSKRLVDSQPSLRAQDIDEVGDNRHTTFFEMLGNWSLGDYFKKEQLPWIWEFITEELHLSKDRLYVSIFEGNDEVSEDTESLEIWKKLGVSKDHIYKYGVKKNWWSRAGIPEQMPVGEIGGCDSEIFFEFDSIKHDPKFGEKCHPNCDCGRFMEIGNSVFMQYKKTEKGLVELPNKNVDFGGGLERMTAATNNDPDVFKIDMFEGLISKVEIGMDKKYEDDKSSYRVLVDHVRAATFLAWNGVVPANKLQGYIMRRLIRRAVVKARKLKNGIIDPNIFTNLVNDVVEYYKDVYFDGVDKKDLQNVIFDEVVKFVRTIDKGMTKFNKVDTKDIDEKFAFDLMQSEGFPFEITAELAKEKGIEIDKQKFNQLVAGHQKLSRESSKDKFKIQ